MAAIFDQTIRPSDYGDDEAAMQQYRADGEQRAHALGNRGPIRFEADGSLATEIAESYSANGFYIFTGVLGTDELADIEADLIDVLDRAPVGPKTKVDRHGRPALGADCQARNISGVRPLSDPVGGSKANYGRHPAKMTEPEAPEGSPEWVVQLVLGSLQFSDACLRVYGHPELLKVAAAINGPDFTPFNEALWIKQPYLGGSVAWHQDPWTHWESPDLDEGTHGFNFMAQLYGCDSTNGLWVVPGSHRRGKADIAAAVEAIGSDRLPDAVPVLCGPGDVCITNRQAIHGSFANTSPNARVTVGFGFHRRASVLGVESGGVHSPLATYDDEYIFERSKLIAYAIDARQQRFPDEERFEYAPFAGRDDEFRWNDAARAAIKDYNLRDLGI